VGQYLLELHGYGLKNRTRWVANGHL